MDRYYRWAECSNTYQAPANGYEKMVVDCFLALSSSSRAEKWSVELRFRTAVDEANRVFDQIAAYRTHYNSPGWPRSMTPSE